MKTTIVAIDPGKQGGMVVRWSDGNLNHVSFKKSEFGDLLAELIDIRDTIRDESWPCVCYFEKPPWTLGKNVPEASAMVFGWSCGMIMGALRALQFPVVEVPPRRYLRYPKDLKTTGQRKRHNREQARVLFPSATNLTLEVADAYLLLNHALAWEAGVER